MIDRGPGYQQMTRPETVTDGERHSGRGRDA